MLVRVDVPGTGELMASEAVEVRSPAGELVRLYGDDEGRQLLSNPLVDPARRPAWFFVEEGELDVHVGGDVVRVVADGAGVPSAPTGPVFSFAGEAVIPIIASGGVTVTIFEIGTHRLATRYVDRTRAGHLPNPFPWPPGGAPLTVYLEPGNYEAEVNGARVFLHAAFDAAEFAGAQ